MLQRLINQAVKLPALLSRFDKLGQLASPSSYALTTQLRNDFRDFIESLWKWESCLRSEESPPLYWVRPTHTRSHLETTKILWYPNIMTANSLTYCWAFEIIARRQLAILETPTTGIHIIQGLGSGFLDSRIDLHIPIESREQRPVGVLAEMICDSVPYLLQPKFKLYGPGSAFFTLPTAMRVFQDEPNLYSSQIVRCQSIIDHLASMGVFFPRT